MGVCWLPAGVLTTPLVGHADRTIGRNQETNTGVLICDSLKWAAQTIVSRALHHPCSRGSVCLSAKRSEGAENMCLPWHWPQSVVVLCSDCAPHPPVQTAAANVMASNAGLPVVCIENAGSIRTDIPAGNVTLGQVTTVLPFGST